MLYSQEKAGFKDEIARFQKRLNAIVEGPADRWQKQFKDDPTTKPLADLLKEFDLFARDYFAHLARGEPTTSLSCDLNTALRRLQREWAIVSRACAQRETQEFKDLLQEADNMAKGYYDRFCGYKETPDATPITYFEKLYAITRSPYTPYPLISIPLYVFNDPTQWQGLAHELGHYIYWNSADLSKYQEIQVQLRNTVLKALSASPENYDDFQKQAKMVDIWMSWLEETFADICGTLLAGPTYVISGQRCVEETAYTLLELIDDDGMHPSPYLRPLIALETLAWVAERPDASAQKATLEAIITSLTERWDESRRKGGGGTHEASNLKMREIEKFLKVVVRAILGESKDEDGYGTWAGADGQPAGLGRLIDYKPWLDDLSEVQAALSIEPTSVQIALEIEDYVPKSSSFEDLVKYLEGEYGAEKKVRKALLSLELEEREEYGCSERCVKKHAGGGYKKCPSC